MFDNGFIEHFRVTSSVVTRKGATHTRKEQEFQSIVDTETAMLEIEWNKTPSFDEVRSKTWTCSNPEHSHEHLVDSFKHNWEHHLLSYQCLPQNQVGDSIFYAPIITGLKKTDKLCYMPHSIYHAYLVKTMLEI